MKSISVPEWVSVMGFFAALSGLIAGVFFAFSSFVMNALARLPAETGIAAMLSINVYAVRSWFLVAFVGTAAACGAVAVMAIVRWDHGSSLLLLGSAAFLIGTFLVTMVFNVPLNNALAALPSAETERQTFWVRYIADWTAWNHVRTVASLAAAVLLTLGWWEQC